MSSFQQDSLEFRALLGLLPADLRDEAVVGWDIGEQEGALVTLVDALAGSGVVVNDMERARIAVLTEAWGCWETLCGPLAACRGDEHAPTTVALIEHTEEGTRATAALARQMADGTHWPGHIAVAWIACRRCDDILVRVHEIMPWGASTITSAYVIVHGGPHAERTLVHGSFDTGEAALAALVETHHPAA